MTGQPFDLDATADASRAESRAALLGRVLAGEVTDAEACRELGVSPTALARWKLQALESIDVAAAPGAPPPGLAAGAGPVGRRDRRHRTGRTRPAPPPVAPRTVAVGTFALIGVVLAVVVVSPAGVAGLEMVDALVRWLMYAASLVAIGGVLFLWQVHDHNGGPAETDALRWWVQAAALVGVTATLVTLATHGAVLAGAGPFGLLDHHSMARAASGAFGASIVLRLLGLVYVAYAVRRLPAPSAQMVATVGSLVVLASFLLVGHTATSEPRALVVVANLVHTLTGAAWIGGLVLLAVTLRHRRVSGDLQRAGGVVRRFSTVAMGTVAAAVVAGTALALVEIPGPRALVTTGYGLTLLTKIVLVAVVIAVAAYNQRRLVPAVEAGEATVWTQLRLTVGIEITGLVLVLLATALLVDLAPPG